MGKMLPKVNVSFCGCGFLGLYHAGSMHAWLDHGGSFVVSHTLGASAGAIVATALALRLPTETVKKKFLRAAALARRHPLGAFTPSCDLSSLMREEFESVLPADAHQQVSSRLTIALTTTGGRSVKVNEFLSRGDLIDCLICSCFLPAFSSYRVPTFRGVRYLDGGLSDNQPVLPDETTVRVSAFAGGSDVAPLRSGGKMMIRRFGGEEVEVSHANYIRLRWAFFPPKNGLEGLYDKGYEDTEKFILSGLVSKFYT